MLKVKAKHLLFDTALCVFQDMICLQNSLLWAGHSIVTLNGVYHDICMHMHAM